MPSQTFTADTWGSLHLFSAFTFQGTMHPSVQLPLNCDTRRTITPTQSFQCWSESILISISYTIFNSKCHNLGSVGSVSKVSQQKIAQDKQLIVLLSLWLTWYLYHSPWYLYIGLCISLRILKILFLMSIFNVGPGKICFYLEENIPHHSALCRYYSVIPTDCIIFFLPSRRQRNSCFPAALFLLREGKART